jgi:hypothetical protein
MASEAEGRPGADGISRSLRGISTAVGAVLALSLVALIAFAAVALQELQYASDHPYAYGPAKVIALAAGAGAVLSAAVAVLARALLKAARP